MATPLPAALPEPVLDRLFHAGRTHNAFLPEPVPDGLLRRLYETARWGPTSMNIQPMRVVFVRTPAAKERLRPALSPGNLDKTLAAPVTAIVAHDTRFHELMDTIWHQPGAGASFAADPAAAERTALRNATLQAAYLMIAARALGLDVGPMAGFDAAKVDAAFFPDGRWKSNLLCNLGYGDPSKLFARNRRLDFDEACRLA